MKKELEFQAAYLPVGVGTFHLESAEKLFHASVEMLEGMCEIAKPEEMLLSIDLLKEYLNAIHPDLLIIQNITFANGAYASEILHSFPDVPVLLWTLREPVIDGGRLRLNSLTGAYSAANAIRQMKNSPFAYVYGSPDEEKVQKEIRDVIEAAKLKKYMKHMTLASIGHTPQGFGFGRALDLDLLTSFGVHHEAIEARELIERAKGYSDEECASYLERAYGKMKGLEKTAAKNRLDFARLLKAYETWIGENGIDAIASRCWPDYFTSYGTPVCAVLAMLNDEGVAAACEADGYGALSMALGMYSTGKPVFFGDPVSLNEEENTISFWHCGTAACSLARSDTGAEVGEHCNRHIGPTMEFGCKAEKDVTIFRIGRNPDGTFRFFIAKGEALDKPKQFLGTSVVVRTADSAEKIVKETVQMGFEPHYVVIYGDMVNVLKNLADMLNMEAVVYEGEG